MSSKVSRHSGDSTFCFWWPGSGHRLGTSDLSDDRAAMEQQKKDERLMMGGVDNNQTDTTNRQQWLQEGLRGPTKPSASVWADHNTNM